MNNTMHRECSDKGIPCFALLQYHLEYGILSLNTQLNGETDW